MNHCHGIEISILFCCIGWCPFQGSFNCLKLFLQALLLWRLSVYRVLFKEETVWVHPILKLPKISFTNALFRASFPKLFVEICSRFCIFLTGSLSFLNTWNFFPPNPPQVYCCWLSRSLIQCLIACMGSLFNSMPQTAGLLGRGKHQEQARGTSVSLPVEEDWSHCIIYFKTV
jgi:hypothetical protein